MGALRNPKHEAAAHALVAGRSQEEAAEIGGLDPKGKSFASNARRFCNSEPMQKRVAELRAPGIKKAEELAEITTEYLLAKLQNLVEFNRDDYLSEPDEEGERHYTLKGVSRELLARLSSARIGRVMMGRGKKRRVVTFVNDVDGHDPLKAVQLIAQIKGLMAPEQHKHDVGDGLAAVLREIDGRTRGLPQSQSA